MKSYDCNGIIYRDGDRAAIAIGHARDFSTGVLVLYGKTIFVPWSSLPDWVALMHGSLSKATGAIPFDAYLVQDDDSDEVRMTFCQPDTILKSILSASHGDPLVDESLFDEVSFDRLRGKVGLPRADARLREFQVRSLMGWLGIEAVPNGEGRSFTGKADLVLEVEIFRR